MDRQASLERNTGIDILKAICSFLVVYIHCGIRGSSGEIIYLPITDIAVPIFFMISGYFYSENKSKRKAQIKRIFSITVLSSMLYLIWGFIYHHTWPIGWTMSRISMRSIISFLFFNIWFLEGGHLWYLWAFLYVLIILCALNELKNGKVILKMMTVILIIAGIVIGAYAKVLLKTDIDLKISRSFLFEGIPFFCIGTMVKENKDKINIILNNIILVLCVPLDIVEGLWLKSLDSGGYRIITVILGLTLLIYFMLGFKGRFKSAKVIAKIGKEYSMYIYIVHIIVFEICNIIFNKISEWKCIYCIISPFLIYLCSLIVSYVYVNYIKEKANKTIAYIRGK